MTHRAVCVTSALLFALCCHGQTASAAPGYASALAGDGSGPTSDNSYSVLGATIEAVRIPETGILVLIGIGLVGLVIFTRRHKRRKGRMDD